MPLQDRLTQMKNDELRRQQEIEEVKKRIADEEQKHLRVIEARYRALEKRAWHQLYLVLHALRSAYLPGQPSHISVTRVGSPEKPAVEIRLEWGEQQDGDIQFGWRRGHRVRILLDGQSYLVYAVDKLVKQVFVHDPRWQSRIEDTLVESLAAGQTGWAEAWDRRLRPIKVQVDKPKSPP